MEDPRTSLLFRAILGFLAAYFLSIQAVIVISVIVLVYRGIQILKCWQRYEGFSQMIAIYLGAKALSFLASAWATELVLHKEELAQYLGVKSWSRALFR